MVIVDSHCHLDDDRLYPDVAGVLERARAAGVQYMQSICTTRKDFPIIHKLALENKGLFCSYGIHPHHADDDVATYDELVEHGRLPKVIGIGETGLDYFYDNAPRQMQQESFKTHIRAARALDLPVIIHTRNADEDTMAIMDELRAEGPYKALFHCFSSTPALADYAVKHGIYVSASGILTFGKAEEVREGFRRVPLELLMVETDAPYLAPMPHRGKTCEPAHTILTAQYLADLKHVPFEVLAKATTDNFFKLFSRATRECEVAV